MSKFKRLRKISMLFDDSISTLSDDELRKLIRECRNLTQTNCWFLLYELKDIVIDRAKDLLGTRAFLRRKKARQKKKRW